MIEFRVSESEAAERPPALCSEPMDFNRFMSPVPPGAPQEELSAVAPTAGTGIQGRTGSAREDGRPAQPPQRGPGGPAQGVLQRGTVLDFFLFLAFLFCLTLNLLTMLCDDGYDHSHTLRVASVTCVCVTATLLD